jgi:hypothetical protein
MTKRILFIGLAVALGLCVAGVIVAAVIPHGPHAPAVVLPTEPAARPTTSAIKAAARTTIAGDDVVHVGEDVPAGVYRVAAPVTADEGCYWLKSSDSEGVNIIDNGLPTGGRPQVTLKAGQWFTSDHCPTWVKR